MARKPLESVVRHLRRAALLQDGAGLTDGELLGAFVSRQDEAAFEALVRRHGRMVLGVCRRVLRNEADAEDAFQATFLVLVRKAPAVAPRALVGNWLYGVAHKTALKARAMNRKRRAKEREAATISCPSNSDKVSPELLDRLDEELSRLSDKYRTAIVLCDLEGKTIQDAAQLLECPQGTIASRLARGREKLAKRLARHGLALSAGALAQDAASASVPPALIASTVRAALFFTAGQGVVAGVISAKVIGLAKGGLPGMFTAKILTAILLIGGFLGLGLGVARHYHPPGDGAVAAQRVGGERDQAESPEMPETDEQADIQPRAIFDQAIEVAGKIDDAEAKATVLMWIAKAQALAGDKDAATTSFKQAEGAAREIKNDLQRAGWFPELARSQAEVGDFKAAMQTANAIQTPSGMNVESSYDRWAKSRIAVEQARSGDVNAALTLANAIPEGDVIYETPKSVAIRDIAGVQADSGDLQGALKTAGSIRFPYERALALGAIALAQGKGGDKAAAQKTLKEAIDIANQIGKPRIDSKGRSQSDYRALALARLVGVMVELGDMDYALKTTRALPQTGNYQMLGLYDIARAQARTKDFQGALQTAGSISNAGRKDTALKEIAIAQAAAGDIEAALATTKDMTHYAYWIETLVGIARAQLKAGARANAAKTLQHALQAVDRVQDTPGLTYAKPKVSRQLAAAQAEIGDQREALAWIEKLEDPFLKASALLGMAEGLTGKGKEPPPRQEGVKRTAGVAELRGWSGGRREKLHGAQKHLQFFAPMLQRCFRLPLQPSFGSALGSDSSIVRPIASLNNATLELKVEIALATCRA